MAGWVGLDQVGHGWVRPGMLRIHTTHATHMSGWQLIQMLTPTPGPCPGRCAAAAWRGTFSGSAWRGSPGAGPAASGSAGLHPLYKLGGAK
eukprot:gene9701-biopygen6216